MRYRVLLILLALTIQTADAMEFMMVKEKKAAPPPQEIPAQTETVQKKPRAQGDYYSLSPSDLEKISDYVQAYPGMEDKRITTALDKLEKNMPDYSQSDCSQGVRKAIMAERSIDIFRGANAAEVKTIHGREAATGYGLDRMLRRNGYAVVPNSSNYTPQRGDVQSIFYGKEINGYSGHAQYYDGDSWISDHRQSQSATNPDNLRAQGIDPAQVVVTTYRRKG